MSKESYWPFLYWRQVSSRDEAKSAVEYIKDHPSVEWLTLLEAARAGVLLYSDILLDNSDEIYEGIAGVIAEEDGIVISPKDE